MSWPFGGMRPLSYGLVMVDPPWAFKVRSAKGEGKSPQAQYECMSLDDIKRLPVGQLAAPDCLLWLWATNPMLPQALEVMQAWGFRFTTAGTWVKTTTHNKLAFGTGYVLRSANEPFLIGTIGQPKASRSVRSVVLAKVREHSRKPDEAYAAAETLAINATRRADIFSRETRPGWDSWGIESGKFDAEAA